MEVRPLRAGLSALLLAAALAACGGPGEDGVAAPNRPESGGRP